ncbi:hypothetical protein GGI42DRAFT_185304 [Trichoderma sp. SZMC 28013]
MGNSQRLDARPGNVLGQTVMSQPGLALLVLAARLSKRAATRFLDARNLDVNLYQSLPYIHGCLFIGTCACFFCHRKEGNRGKKLRRTSMYILTRLPSHFDRRQVPPITTPGSHIADRKESIDMGCCGRFGDAPVPQHACKRYSSPLRKKHAPMLLSPLKSLSHHNRPNLAGVLIRVVFGAVSEVL